MLSRFISFIGVGFVGLSTSVGFAAKGYKVLVYDNDPAKIKLLSEGSSSFYEAELEKHLQNVINSGLLATVPSVEETVTNTNITFITVGTPSKSDGTINLRYVKDSVLEIGKALAKKENYHLVVVKSTVIPGTTIKIIKPLLEKHSNKRCGIDFGLCTNPEFLREGSALHDTLHPDRIIIGEYDRKSGDTLESLYNQFKVEDRTPILRTNLSTAELIKYANNAFLATKISYINTIANICERIPETDIQTIAKAIGLDKRINPKFLQAGLGYGGSCFPKDLKALIAFSKQNNYNPTLLESVQKVNQQQINHIIELLETELGNLTSKKIAILGLSFKPETDDMREARSTLIINKLLNKGAKISAYDPVALPNAKKIFNNKIEYSTSPIHCLKAAHCCIIATEWNEFKKLTPEDYQQYMKIPFLIDGRRIYDPDEFKHRINYKAIGLGR
jgi:UDPglucose 6-dehydrogenase